ncbi:MAG: hypothetical protein ACMZ63_01245 [Methylotenera sp.]
MNKFIMTLASVASLLCLCKPVLADGTESWLHGFNVGGYSSAGLTLERDQEARAALNEVSLLVTWNGDSRLSFFGELELENPLSWNDDRQFHSKESRFDLERLYFDYNISEKVNFRAGRFLTPNSRWNLLHAPPLVWTSTRPLATTRLFPEGTNGAMIFGALPFMDGAFEYKVFAELLEDQEQDDDELEFEHVKGVRLSYKKQSDIGISFLSFQEKDLDSSYRMLGLDFVTHLSTIEISGEAFQRFDTRNKDGGSGAYLQSAVPLNNLGLDDWYWITRIETLQRPNEGSSERWLIGTTWRVKPQQLLKFEFTGGSGDQPESPRGFLTSFALFF